MLLDDKRSPRCGYRQDAASGFAFIVPMRTAENIDKYFATLDFAWATNRVLNALFFLGSICSLKYIIERRWPWMRLFRYMYQSIDVAPRKWDYVFTDFVFHFLPGWESLMEVYCYRSRQRELYNFSFFLTWIHCVCVFNFCTFSYYSLCLFTSIYYFRVLHWCCIFVNFEDFAKIPIVYRETMSLFVLMSVYNRQWHGISVVNSILVDFKLKMH